MTAVTDDPVVELDRLRDSRDVVAVLRGGRRRAGRYVVVHSRPRTGADPSGDEGPRDAPVTDGNPTVGRGKGDREVGDPAAGGPAGGPSSEATPRVAVVASRKVGSAVARNRAKRVLREAARRVDWSAHTDVVLVARDQCAATAMGVVLEELRELADELSVTRAAA